MSKISRSVTVTLTRTVGNAHIIGKAIKSDNFQDVGYTLEIVGYNPEVKSMITKGFMKGGLDAAEVFLVNKMKEFPEF